MTGPVVPLRPPTQRRPGGATRARTVVTPAQLDAALDAAGLPRWTDRRHDDSRGCPVELSLPPRRRWLRRLDDLEPCLAVTLDGPPTDIARVLHFVVKLAALAGGTAVQAALAAEVAEVAATGAVVVYLPGVGVDGGVR